MRVDMVSIYHHHTEEFLRQLYLINAHYAGTYASSIREINSEVRIELRNKIIGK